MKGKAVFLDTNILVYAHDRAAGRKRVTARRRVRELWELDRPPSISVQVLQELYVNLIRKQVPAKAARETVADYLEWHVVDNDRDLLIAGISEGERWKLSFWDALIVAAARRAGADIIWSEDLNPGQRFDGVVVVNPLGE